MQLSFARCRNVCEIELTIVSSWTFESRPLLMVSSGKLRSGVASPLGGVTADSADVSTHGSGCGMPMLILAVVAGVAALGKWRARKRKLHGQWISPGL